MRKNCLSQIREKVAPVEVEVIRNLAIIAVVGRDLGTSPAIAVKVLGALANRKINIKAHRSRLGEVQYEHRRRRRGTIVCRKAIYGGVYEKIKQREMVKEEQMIIKDAILHIMDFASDVCVFSEQQLDLSENGTGEFIEKHLSRLIDDSAAKEGNFSDYSIFSRL